MKSTIKYSLLAAAVACGFAQAETAYTTPVGYYGFEGKAGGNMFVPSLVKSPVFAGVLTAANSTTLTVASGSITSGAYDKGAIYATHYIEITSGPNAGVALDVLSNTDSVITLVDDISALALTGVETIKIRPHVTLKSSLADAETALTAYNDTATFYTSDGGAVTYIYGADGATGWSSDFATADGDSRPVAPGTGFVLGLSADASLNVTGEVKPSDTVVMLGAGVINIVGPVNPLVGTTKDLNTTGFAALGAYTDSISIYVPGPLVDAVTYYALGDGTVSSDFATPTTDTINNTTGAVVIPLDPTALRIFSGFTVVP